MQLQHRSISQETNIHIFTQEMLLSTHLPDYLLLFIPPNANIAQQSVFALQLSHRHRFHLRFFGVIMSQPHFGLLFIIKLQFNTFRGKYHTGRSDRKCTGPSLCISIRFLLFLLLSINSNGISSFIAAKMTCILCFTAVRVGRPIGYCLVLFSFLHEIHYMRPEQTRTNLCKAQRMEYETFAHLALDRFSAWIIMNCYCCDYLSFSNCLRLCPRNDKQHATGMSY